MVLYESNLRQEQTISTIKFLTRDELQKKYPKWYEELLQAKAFADHAYPRNNTTRVGCMLVADGQAYMGANVKREESWFNATTCAERYALDSALLADAQQFERLLIWGTSRRELLQGVIIPCGSCQDILDAALHYARQHDMDVVLSNPAMTQIVVCKFSELPELKRRLREQ